MRAFDRRDWDDNGWYTVYDNPLSRAGVFPYSEASIVRGGDRNKMINVFLPPEELESQEAVKSFRLLPWTDDHPSELLGPKEKGLVPAEQKGIQGVIGEDVYFKGGTLYGNIKVFSEDLARKIASGKRELSCGYRCDFVPQEGVYNGERYQYVQRNVRGNHTASVSKGRRGPEIRVLDAAEGCFTFALDMSAQIVPATPATENDVTIETISRMVRDAVEEAVRNDQKDAARAERLRTRLGSLIGVVPDEHVTSSDVAKYGMEKLNLEPPDSGDHATALEYFMAGCTSHAGQDGKHRGMDSRGDSFVDKYIAA